MSVLQSYTSCAPLVPAQILQYPRADTIPGEQNITFPGSVVWDNKTYDMAVIQYNDFSTRLSVGENVPDGGYIVQKKGTYRVSLG